MKIVHGNIYVYRSNLEELSDTDQKLVTYMQMLLPSNFEWNLVRLTKDRNKITFSLYSDFYTDPHPALNKYASINMLTKEIKYGQPKHNPVILHRKETFIRKTDPYYETYKNLTLQEMAVGLYQKDLLSYIGRKDFWEALLIKKGLTIVNHVLQRI